jgi:hypothetical protein
MWSIESEMFAESAVVMRAAAQGHRSALNGSSKRMSGAVCFL